MTAPRGLPRDQLLVGDVRAKLAELPDDSVDCVITSPPYYALRDYGQAGQLGLETDVNGWVQNLVTVTDEIRRVLKPSGSLWLNVADSYSHHPREGAPKKSLLLGPQRLALAMVARGWLLRNQVIWAKTNPMPSNVTDRLSCTHEFVYFFTKSPRYFFDLNAIRVPLKARQERAGARPPTNRVYPPPGALPRRGDRAQNFNGGLAKLKSAGLVGHPCGKNPGDVWAMGTAAYHGQHFAVFPPHLVERPLLATCPERTCAACGKPWLPTKQRLHGRLLAVGLAAPQCRCQAAGQPGVVLDPFMGSGTVALVAEQQRRDWVGIELSPAFAALAEDRLERWRHQQRPAS